MSLFSLLMVFPMFFIRHMLNKRTQNIGIGAESFPLHCAVLTSWDKEGISGLTHPADILSRLECYSIR